MTAPTFKKIRKAVFPVAGLGTRFLPATKVIPKEMLILGDRPLIQHAVEEAAAAGIEEFIFVSSRGKVLLEDHFKSNSELAATLEKRGKTDLLEAIKSSDISEGKLFVTHQNRPLGLGHAVWCAKNLVGDEPFAVILPDETVLGEKGCMAQMVEVYNQTGGNLIAVAEVPKAETSKYGILDIAKDDGKLVEVKGLVEKPAPEKAPSNLSIIGRYILQPEVFGPLSTFSTGSGGEIQLTDAMAQLVGKQPFHGMRFEGTRHDCGSYPGLVAATIDYALRDPRIAAGIKAFIQEKAKA
jgi:UTP--glucose-1-phosphate uridylyltransferase